MNMDSGLGVKIDGVYVESENENQNSRCWQAIYNSPDKFLTFIYPSYFSIFQESGNCFVKIEHNNNLKISTA